MIGWAAVALVLSAAAHAAFEERPVSARSAGLAGATAGLVSGADAAYNNPAALRFADRTSFSAGHARLLSLSDMDLATLGAALPTERSGAWGVFGSVFGSSLYRESEAGLAWAGDVAPGTALGVALKGQRVDMDRYGSHSALQGDVGLFGSPLKRVYVGVVLKNITQQSLGASGEAPPALFSAGGSALFFPGGVTALSVSQDADGRRSWRAGQEVCPHPALAVRAGFQSAPDRFSLGLGVRGKTVTIDYALSTQAQWPEQHHISLSLDWPGR